MGVVWRVDACARDLRIIQAGNHQRALSSRPTTVGAPVVKKVLRHTTDWERGWTSLRFPRVWPTPSLLFLPSLSSWPSPGSSVASIAAVIESAPALNAFWTALPGYPTPQRTFCRRWRSALCATTTFLNRQWSQPPTLLARGNHSRGLVPIPLTEFDPLGSTFV
jgi:hypothetical protein